MHKSASVIAIVVALFWMASAVAQTPSTRTGDLVLNPIAATSGTGVSNVALINRDEIRVLRVDLAAGGVRNIHTHDDVPYHLFIPITGRIQFETESEKPVDLAPWQAHFVKGGTKHGFKNLGNQTVSVMEVFVKK